MIGGYGGDASDSVRNLEAMFDGCMQMKVHVNCVIKSYYHQFRNTGSRYKLQETPYMLVLAAD